MWKVVLGLLLVAVAAGAYWLQKGDSATPVYTVTVVRGSIESSLQLRHSFVPGSHCHNNSIFFCGRIHFFKSYVDFFI